MLIRWLKQFLNQGLKKIQAYFVKIPQTLKVGFFLAWSSIKRASVGTTALVIIIQIVTILNLVVVQGILVGIVEGGNKQFREQYSGDVLISPLPNLKKIKDTPIILNKIKTLEPKALISVRYLEGAKVQDNYRDLRKPGELLNEVSTTLVGVNPETESRLSGIDKTVIEGRWLLPSDTNGVVLGADLFKKYNSFANAGFRLLTDKVQIGSKVKIALNDSQSKEFTVVGIVKSKVDQLGVRAFVLDRELLNITGRENLNAREIAIRLPSVSDSQRIADELRSDGVADLAIVENWEEAIPSALKEVSQTFTGLGQMVGAIGLLVSTITMFIVTFVNVVTRRKFIGILKAIGVSEDAIELSYMLQAFSYALIGSVIGGAIVGFIIKPYFDVHPFDFPFTDGILATSALGITIRCTILCLTGIVAGYLPARKIARGNTLDAILGRN